MAANPPPLGTPVPEVRDGAGIRRRWLPAALVVLLVFLLGAAAGAVVTSVTREEAAGVTTTTTTTTSTVPDRDERQDRACVAAIDAALDALDLVATAARAVSDLDGPALERAVGQVEEVRPEVTETLERCRRAVG